MTTAGRDGRTGSSAGGQPLPWSSGVAWIDNDYCPIEDASISILDWGVTRSDCTYDVVHVWNGRFFRLHDHLQRFRAGATRLRLRLELDDRSLAEVLEECVRRSGLRDAYVSMTCTRGRPQPGSRDLRSCENRLYCFAIPFVWIVPPDQQEVGADLWVSDRLRIPPDSVDPRVKNYHWLDMTMALWDAYDQGAQLVLLRGAEGTVTEGPGYNVFVRCDGRWVTPSAGTLEGITRRTTIEVIRSLGTPVDERPLRADELDAAQEVFITSTAGGVMPVSTVNGVPVCDGRPGEETLRIRERYWALHDDPAYATPVRYG